MAQRGELKFSSSFLLPVALLVAASVALTFAIGRVGGRSSTAFLTAATASEEPDDADSPGGPLDWLHYKVILASRKSYPLALMIGFNCYGNVLLRKECADKPYPNWLFGVVLGFTCYTYPGAVFSDLLFVPDTPRAMANDSIFLVFIFWFVVIQNCEPVYKFFLRKHVFIFITVWWLADATRASLCFLERAVAHHPVFAHGMWQCFIWCAAGPIVRVAEASIRGAPIPKLDKLLPNSFNSFKYPLVAMWMIMVAYMVYMMYFTDCNILGKHEGPKLTMVECGDKHDDVYAAFVYLACLLHFARGYWGLYAQGGMVVFGETFCLGSAQK